MDNKNEVSKDSPLTVPFDTAKANVSSVWVPKTPQFPHPPSSKPELEWPPMQKALISQIPTATTKVLHDSPNRKTVLNVGGERHEILSSHLEKYPKTRLGRLNQCSSHDEMMTICDDYSFALNEYFFDRSPASFPAILNLYRRGKFHLAEDICVLDFADDLEYWGIDELYLDGCCQLKFQQKKEQLHEEMKKDYDFLEGDDNKKDDFGNGCCARYRKYIWELFEKSVTIPQKVTALVSIFTIVLSIITLSLSTVPDLQEYQCVHNNQTKCEEILSQTVTSSSTSDTSTQRSLLLKEHFTVMENTILDKLELYCIIWFTFEYLLRLFAAPSKAKFFKGWLNNIDLIAIAPFYVSLFLVQFESQGRLLQVLRVIRILRIFKLARHSVGLQSLGFTLRHSYKGLGVLLLFLTVGVIIFSTLAYFAERDDNESGFESIPHAFYWGAITMTTVGYGDVSPVTFLGKVVSMMAGICGVIVIALPIPIVVNNFALFYEEQNKRDKAVKRQKALQALRNGDDERSKGKSYIPVSMVDPLGLGNDKGGAKK